MTGPGHFKMAEQLLDMATEDVADSDMERYHLAAAQAHATLALAAAQVVTVLVDGDSFEQWRQAVTS